MDKFATQKEIEYAYSILFNGKSGSFEQDKVDIIECNESKDIKACPGSGKTTTLLAKLIILANRMPLPNNQGICVLTHTNVAIDEIKKKLGHKADILFKYPNHFGTIQSFVDKFLAIPSLKKYYNTNLHRVDSDNANKSLLFEFQKLDQYSDKLHTFLYMRFYENLSHITAKEINLWINKLQIPTLKHDLITAGVFIEKGKKVKNIFLDCKKSSWNELNKIVSNKDICVAIYEKRKEINKQIEEQKKELIPTLDLDFITNTISKDSLSFRFLTDSGKSFIQLKESVFQKGLLSFNDAYSLAFRYCNDAKNILNVAFSFRFKYLFIDEMQDTDIHQLDIIKNAFDKKTTIIQRFGDHRQAIYQKVKDIEQWNPQNALPINDSKRFGENIANVLRYVCCEQNDTLQANPSVNSLTPVMIVYENHANVLPKFCELLTIKKIGEKNIWEFSQEIKNKGDTSYKIKAIGWVGQENPKGFTIKSYFSNFNAHARKKGKVDYESVKSFLRRQEGAKILDYSNNIIDVFLHILSIVNIKYTKGKTNRSYTKTALLEDFENKSSEKLHLLKSNIARWAKNIHNSEAFCNNTIDEIRQYIKTEFCPIWEIDSTNKYINDFLENSSVNLATEEEIKNNNVFNQDDVEVEIATIHSVKGETHTATLYLETYYQGQYESERILEQLKKNYYIPAKKKDIYKKETLKMAHVGMSRPKYFLCMAVHKDRFKDSFDVNNGGMWEIVIA